MNDSAMRLMVRAHREQLLSIMRHSRVSPEELSDPVTRQCEYKAIPKEERMVRIVVASAVAMLGSVVFAFILADRMSQIAALHAPSIASTQEGQTGRPATTAGAAVNGMASSDVQQANR